MRVLLQVVKAEDCRLLSNVRTMKEHYRALRDLNRDLVTDHDRRATKHSELHTHLKTLNRVIYAAARLRGGAPRDACLAAARAAVKSQDCDALLRALREGA